MFCDDAGRHPANLRRTRMECFPGDDFAEEQVAGWISELIDQGLLLEYACDGKRYWQVTGWAKHQRIDRPSYKYPPLDSHGKPLAIDEHSTNDRRAFDEHSTNTRRTLDEHSTSIRRAFDEHSTSPTPRKGMEGKGRERKGKEGKGSTLQKASFCKADKATAEWMFGLVKKVAPHAKPTLDDWADTIRLMRERDDLDDATIRQVFAFANADEFWMPNVLSPRKLREKFTDLEAKMRVANGTVAKRATPPPPPRPRRAADV